MGHLLENKCGLAISFAISVSQCCHAHTHAFGSDRSDEKIKRKKKSSSSEGRQSQTEQSKVNSVSNTRSVFRPADVGIYQWEFKSTAAFEQGQQQPNRNTWGHQHLIRGGWKRYIIRPPSREQHRTSLSLPSFSRKTSIQRHNWPVAAILRTIPFANSRHPAR